MRLTTITSSLTATFVLTILFFVLQGATMLCPRAIAVEREGTGSKTGLQDSLNDLDRVSGNYVGELRRAERTIPVKGKMFAMPGKDTYHCALLFEGKRFLLTSGFGAAGKELPVYATAEGAAAGGERSVRYAYYEGTWEKLPDFSQLEPMKVGTCPPFDLSVRGRNDHFAVKFTGFIRVPEDGQYLFSIQSDDGSRLVLGDDFVVDNDGLHGGLRRTGDTELKAGTYPVTVTFFEKEGGEELSVGYLKHAIEQEASKGLKFVGRHEGVAWEGRLKDETLRVTAEDPARGEFLLKRTWIEAEGAGMKPPKNAVILLPFKKGRAPSLDAWINPSWEALADGSMLVGKGDNRTRERFGSCRLHVEFLIPYQPEATGQGRGNSGVYLMDRYEVQVLDSFGLVPQMGDCGAVYGVAPPKTNACLPPLTWQTYDIEFRAPKMGPGGQLVEKPSLTVRQNGILIHENQPVPGPTTASGNKGHAIKGPLKLQDHGNPVRYRNIWLVELD